MNIQAVWESDSSVVDVKAIEKQASVVSRAAVTEYTVELRNRRFIHKVSLEIAVAVVGHFLQTLPYGATIRSIDKNDD